MTTATTTTPSLRITCYGSSSSKTPKKYMDEAFSLGNILAKRGHVCVNGAGSYGCMSAMNDGAMAGHGHIVGVIHEMFLVDNGFWGNNKTIARDGGSHRAFHSTKTSDKTSSAAPIREILVARGDDLQERKKLLVENTQGLIVLPGGPGTWDELWEMACARNLGLVSLPIVCINVDQYYEPFRVMLERAWKDELIKLAPNEIVHFAASAEEAVSWIENENQKNNGNTETSTGTRNKQSLLGRLLPTQLEGKDALQTTVTFALGVCVGAAVLSRKKR